MRISTMGVIFRAGLLIMSQHWICFGDKGREDLLVRCAAVKSPFSSLVLAMLVLNPVSLVMKNQLIL